VGRANVDVGDTPSDRDRAHGPRRPPKSPDADVRRAGRYGKALVTKQGAFIEAYKFIRALEEGEDPPVDRERVLEAYRSAIPQIEEYVKTQGPGSDSAFLLADTLQEYGEFLVGSQYPDSMKSQREEFVTAHKDEAEKLFERAIELYRGVAKAVRDQHGDDVDPDSPEGIRIKNAQYQECLAAFRLALIYPKGARFLARSEDAELILDAFFNRNYDNLYGAYGLFYLGRLNHVVAIRDGDADKGEIALHYFEKIIDTINEDPGVQETIDVLAKAFLWYSRSANSLATAEGELKRKDTTRYQDVLRMGRTLEQKMRYGVDAKETLLAQLEVADATAAIGRFESAVSLAGQVLAKARAAGHGSVVTAATGKLTDWVANVGGGGALPPELLAQIGDSLAAQDVTAKAITFYERAVAASKTEEQIEQIANEAWKKIASAYRRDKRYFAAGDIAWRVVQDFLESKQGPETAFYQTASEACWQAVQAYKAIADATKRSADRTKYEKVLETFRNSFPDHPQNADAAFSEALDSYNDGDFEEAAAKFQAISTASPSYWSAQMRVPVCYLRLANADDAKEPEKWFEKALAASVELQDLASKQSDLPAAQAAKRSGLMLQAVALHALERWEEAIQAIDRYFKDYPGVFPGKGREFKIKIDALLTLGRLEEAEAALAQLKTKIKGSRYIPALNYEVYKALRDKYKPLGGRERVELAKRASALWEERVLAKPDPSASDYWFLADVRKDAHQFEDAGTAYAEAAKRAEKPGQRDSWNLAAAEMKYKAARENKNKMDPAEYRKVLAETRELFLQVLLPDKQQRETLLPILANGKKWPTPEQWKWIAAKPEPLLTAAEVCGESSPAGLDGRWIGVRLLDKLDKITEPVVDDPEDRLAQYVNTWWEGAQLKLELYLAIAEAQSTTAWSDEAAQFGFAWGKKLQLQYQKMDGPDRVNAVTALTARLESLN